MWKLQPRRVYLLSLVQRGMPNRSFERFAQSAQASNIDQEGSMTWYSRRPLFGFSLRTDKMNAGVVLLNCPPLCHYLLEG